MLYTGAVMRADAHRFRLYTARPEQHIHHYDPDNAVTSSPMSRSSLTLCAVALSNRSPAWRHQPEVLHLTQLRPSGPKVDVHALSPMRRTCWVLDFMNAWSHILCRSSFFPRGHNPTGYRKWRDATHAYNVSRLLCVTQVL